MSVDFCPHGYGDPHAWCAWRNGELAADNKGLVWVVGADGRPFITDDVAVSAERHQREALARDEERRRFNHRQMHPVTEET